MLLVLDHQHGRRNVTCKRAIDCLASYDRLEYHCERFEPRSHFKSRLSLIVRVNVAPE